MKKVVIITATTFLTILLITFVRTPWFPRTISLFFPSNITPEQANVLYISRCRKVSYFNDDNRLNSFFIKLIQSANTDIIYNQETNLFESDSKVFSFTPNIKENQDGSLQLDKICWKFEVAPESNPNDKKYVFQNKYGIYEVYNIITREN